MQLSLLAKAAKSCMLRFSRPVPRHLLRLASTRRLLKLMSYDKVSHMPRFSRFFRIMSAMVLVLAIADTCVLAVDPNSESILGKWLVTRVGKRDATKLPFQIEWEFTKDEVIVRDLTNAQEISRNHYVIDVSQNPKWITVTVVDKEKEIRNGVFEIVGEELHLKQTVGAGPRATSFPKGDFVIMKRNLNKKAN
jgi:uncharacterized protein (TIGR03067 family)